MGPYMFETARQHREAQTRLLYTWFDYLMSPHRVVSIFVLLVCLAIRGFLAEVRAYVIVSNTEDVWNLGTRTCVYMSATICLRFAEFAEAHNCNSCAFWSMFGKDSSSLTCVHVHRVEVDMQQQNELKSIGLKVQNLLFDYRAGT